MGKENMLYSQFLRIAVRRQYQKRGRGGDTDPQSHRWIHPWFHITQLNNTAKILLSAYLCSLKAPRQLKTQFYDTLSNFL